MQDAKALTSADAALYLNTMLQQHVLQGGQGITLEAFLDLQRRSTLSLAWLYDWPEEAAAGGAWTHYNVLCIPGESVIAVHSSSARHDEWCDSFTIPSSATACRLLPRAEGVFRSMLQLRDVAEQQLRETKRAQGSNFSAVRDTVRGWR